MTRLLKIKLIFSFLVFFGISKIFSQNLLDTSTWNIGSGAVTGFANNGSSNENSRVLGKDNLGNEVTLWKASPDSQNNADGGWNTSYHTINSNKTYRFSVWIKKLNSNSGTTYFGCRGNNGGLVTPGQSGGTTVSNPYFWSGDLPKLNRWYLLVGYIFSDNPISIPGGPISGSALIIQSGIFDGVTGEKVASVQNFEFSSSVTQVMHRAYLYYDTNTNDEQFFL